jgi:hypothetical protein
MNATAYPTNTMAEGATFVSPSDVFRADVPTTSPGRPQRAPAAASPHAGFRPVRRLDASFALFRLHGFRHKWMRKLHMEGLRKAGIA